MADLHGKIKKICPTKVWNFLAEIKNAITISKEYHVIDNSRSKVVHHGQDKLKILFIIQRIEVFNSVKTIFEEALASDECEVFLLPIPRYSSSAQKLDLNSYESVLAFCKSLSGGTIYESYNTETNCFRTLTSLNPDYIFLNVPYTNTYPEEYEIRKLVSVGKVCFVPYGYTFGNMKQYADVYNTEFNTSLLGNVSFLFLDNRFSFKFCGKKLWLSELLDGKRRYSLGYPRFDNIDDSITNNERFTVLWIPRWTTDEQTEFYASTFFAYKDNIVEYAKNNKNFNLIVRPHPVAFDNYIKNGQMSKEDVENYKMKFYGNLSLDENSDYRESLLKADVLIADYSSIIIEYFLLDRPIIYCGNKNDFLKELRYVTDTFYYANDWEKVKTILDNLQNGIDTHKHSREISVQKFRSLSNESGKKILNVLIKDYNIQK